MAGLRRQTVRIRIKVQDAPVVVKEGRAGGQSILGLNAIVTALGVILALFFVFISNRSNQTPQLSSSQLQTQVVASTATQSQIQVVVPTATRTPRPTKTPRPSPVSTRVPTPTPLPFTNVIDGQWSGTTNQPNYPSFAMVVTLNDCTYEQECGRVRYHSGLECSGTLTYLGKDGPRVYLFEQRIPRGQGCSSYEVIRFELRGSDRLYLQWATETGMDANLTRQGT